MLKNGHFNTSKLSTFDKVLDVSQKCLNFFLINARSIQKNYLIQQLDSPTKLIITETWISEQQDTNLIISNDHLFLQKALSKQTGVQLGGVLEFRSPRHFKVKRKK